jgi:enamine deaminase RidA (YjgF/YER057c/UK114 family)
MPNVHADAGTTLAVTHDTTAHLAAVTAPDAGDPGAQARAAWTTALSRLADLGHEPHHVVRVAEYVTFDALAARPVIDAARATALAGHRPAVTTVAVHGLPDGGAIALEVTSDSVGMGSAPAAMPTGEVRPAFASATRTGDLVHVSSVLPLDANGQVVAPDDLVRQTAKVYANAAVILDRFGLGLEDVVKTVEFVPPHVRGAYPKTGFVRKQHLAPPYGGGTGIVMDQLAHPDALIQVDFLASAAPRTKVDCGWERYGKLTYNPGLEVGDTWFVMSGQAALDIATEEAILPGDVVAQARSTYENIARVLDATGLSGDHLVRSVEYVTPDGLARFAEVDAVRRDVLGTPAVTAVVCSGLLRPEFLIEIDPMAVRKGD